MKFIIAEQNRKSDNLQQQEPNKIQIPPYEEENISHQPTIRKAQGSRYKAQARFKVQGTSKVQGTTARTWTLLDYRITNGYLS